MNKNQPYEPHAEFSEWLNYYGRAEKLCRESEMFVPPIISKLKNGIIPFNLAYAMEIDRLTNGLFKAESLCPKHAALITHLRGEAK